VPQVAPEVDYRPLLQCQNPLSAQEFLGILAWGSHRPPGLPRIGNIEPSRLLADLCGGPVDAHEAMKNEEERELRVELERLRQEHRDLDSAIDALLATPGYDRLQVQRLKKRKLQIRDQLGRIEDQLFPDIIA